MSKMKKKRKIQTQFDDLNVGILFKQIYNFLRMQHSYIPGGAYNQQIEISTKRNVTEKNAKNKIYFF